MARSTGITVSAVVVIIGSAFTVLCGAMILVASVLVLISSRAADAPVNLRYVLAIEAVLAFGFGGWGLASGISLIKTKEWARISTLVYAAILVFFCVPSAVVVALVPLPNTPSTNDPNRLVNSMLLVRVGLILLYAMFAALGGYWLYFFNTQKLKAQFRGQQVLTERGQAGLPGIPVVRFGADQRARPLSITIIGWYLIIASALALLSVVFTNTLFFRSKLPFFFLGVFFFGPSTYLLLTVWMTAQVVAAVGLLKLKRWGLIATIALQCVVLLNIVMIAVPANRLRFQQVMETLRFSANGRMYHSAPMFPMWIGMLSSIPIVVVILFFLISQKNFFTSADYPSIIFSCQSPQITSMVGRLINAASAAGTFKHSLRRAC